MRCEYGLMPLTQCLRGMKILARQSMSDFRDVQEPTMLVRYDPGNVEERDWRHVSCLFKYFEGGSYLAGFMKMY